MNEEDADFGDFQTCDDLNIEPLPSQQTKVELAGKEITENIFDFDEDNFNKFVDQFELELSTLFPNDSVHLDENNQLIRSQEDIINDCPIWSSLTGSFKCEPPVNFQKSFVFGLFRESLHLERKESINQQKPNVITNNEKRSTVKRDRFEEDDLASDLDMHSLIIGSYERKFDYKEKNELVNADQVIREIENYFEDDGKDYDKDSNYSEKKQANQENSLLSLNASSLLDVVLKSWETESQPYLVANDKQEEYYSLPVNINSPINNSTDSILNQNNSEVSLSLKASIIYLNAKMSINNAISKERISEDETSMEKLSLTNSNANVQSECLDKLYQLSTGQLNELYIELEQVFQYKSEILCQELANRDELDFEKELKNSFISLLLSVQNKRRFYLSNTEQVSNKHVRRSIMKKRNTGNSIIASDNSRRGLNKERHSISNSLMSRALDLTSFKSSIKESLSFTHSTPTPVYLTTVIPYHKSMSPMDVPTLQMLIKLLIALNENSPTVPALLTDYILKVICQ